MKKEKNPRLNQVGGQAVLEGVMMKAGTDCATACRKSDGTIVVLPRQFHSIRKKCRILNLPLLRGIVNFIEMLVLSMQILTASAEVVVEEEELVESKFELWMRKHLGIKLFDLLMVFAAVLGVVLALTLFLFLPRLAADGVEALVNLFVEPNLDLGVWRAVIEGVLKICIFIAYLLLVGLMPDIRRTFEYHGAEHKSIACYESGEELTPENALRHRRFHPRCGTSFMFVMILLGVAVGIFINYILPGLSPLAYTGIRLLILPVIVGVGYEFIMMAGKHDNAVTRLLSAPGLWMQRITTKEPDEKQLEVAICALKYALVSAFPDFDREAVTYRPEEKTEAKAEDAPEADAAPKGESEPTA
jgi:uncharacterized protein YqhQ